MSRITDLAGASLVVLDPPRRRLHRHRRTGHVKFFESARLARPDVRTRFGDMVLTTIPT